MTFTVTVLNFLFYSSVSPAPFSLLSLSGCEWSGLVLVWMTIPFQLSPAVAVGKTSVNHTKSCIGACHLHMVSSRMPSTNRCPCIGMFFADMTRYQLSRSVVMSPVRLEDLNEKQLASCLHATTSMQMGYRRGLEAGDYTGFVQALVAVLNVLKAAAKASSHSANKSFSA